jgi:hypothetical protein
VSTGRPSFAGALAAGVASSVAEGTENEDIYLTPKNYHPIPWPWWRGIAVIASVQEIPGSIPLQIFKDFEKTFHPMYRSQSNDRELQPQRCKTLQRNQQDRYRIPCQYAHLPYARFFMHLAFASTLT